MRTLFALLCTLLFATQTYAQPGATGTIQNMHLWRGGEVADGLVITADVHYKFASDHLRVGFWGGTNVVGDYKEFNNYINYHNGGFSLTLVDTYNFSENATYNNEEFFNYNASQTGRFLDATLVYDFDDKFPLTLSWATVLYGRDRNVENSHNRYSTFCSASYSLYDRDHWHIDTSVGASFALYNESSSSENFYGEEPGVVEITLKVTYMLTIKSYDIPLSATAMWNPQSNQGYLQLCAQVITF